MEKKKKKAVQPAQKQSPLTKATTAELTAVLAKRGLVVSKQSEPKPYPIKTENNDTTVCNRATLSVLTLADQLAQLRALGSEPDQEIEQLFNLSQRLFGVKIDFVQIDDAKEEDSMQGHLKIIHSRHARNYANLRRVVEEILKHIG